MKHIFVITLYFYALNFVKSLFAGTKKTKKKLYLE